MVTVSTKKFKISEGYKDWFLPSCKQNFEALPFPYFLSGWEAPAVVPMDIMFLCETIPRVLILGSLFLVQNGIGETEDLLKNGNPTSHQHYPENLNLYGKCMCHLNELLLTETGRLGKSRSVIKFYTGGKCKFISISQ